MAKTSNHFLLILCGGTGPRLWPMSRADFPKQFLKIFSDSSLLQDTISRSKKITSANKVFLVSNQKYLTQLKKETKSILSSKNIISEPEKKNTMMAIIYAVSRVSQNNEDIITVLPSDHLISKVDSFKKDILKSAEIAAKTNQIVAIGIKPEFANQSYGYLVSDKKTGGSYHVSKFVEKPEPKLATKLISNNAYWNSGIYTFKVSTLIAQLAKHQPEYHRIFENIVQCHKPQEINKLYKISPSLSIDYAISEKTSVLTFIPATFEWSDIGEWRSIHKHSIPDKQNNSKVGKETTYIALDSTNCLVKSTRNKLVGLLGVSNLAIIDTPDALLVCDMQQSYNVRDLVGQIVKDKKTEKYFLHHEKSKTS